MHCIVKVLAPEHIGQLSYNRHNSSGDEEAARRTHMMVMKSACKLVKMSESTIIMEEPWIEASKGLRMDGTLRYHSRNTRSAFSSDLPVNVSV